MKNSTDSAQEQQSGNDPVDIAVRIGLIALLTFWCLYIAAPFIGPVIWGAIIAIGSYPLYRWLQAKLGLGGGLTATLYTLVHEPDRVSKTINRHMIHTSALLRIPLVRPS